MQQTNLKKKAAHGLLWGGIGAGGMQVLNLVFGVLLSRILSPADYGVVGSLAIFSAVAGMFTESGFTLAIVNRRDVGLIDYYSMFWFNAVVGAVIYAVLWFCAPAIAEFYHTPELVWLSRFLFLSFFLGGLGAAPSAFLFRNLRIKERSRALILSVVVSGSVGIVCALSGLGYWGIAAQSVSYSFVLTCLLWLSAGWMPRFRFSSSSILGMLPFSMKQMVVSLFTHFNNNFFAVLLGRYYGMSVTGDYTQGNKWTVMGYSTLTGMINSVGQPVMREAGDDMERVRRVFRKMLRFASFLSFPLMFGLAAVSEELIVIAVTAKWIEAAKIMWILCVGGAFMPLATLYGNLFNSQGRPGIFMWNTIALGCVQVGTLLITCRYSIHTMLMVYVCINVAWLFVWQTCAWRVTGLRYCDVFADTVPYAVLAFLSVATGYGVSEWIANMDCLQAPALGNFVSLVIKVVVSATVYCGLMLMTGSAMFKEVLGYFKK